MESQWASVSRLVKVREDASSHLRTLDARLDELVARVVELSVTGASDVGGLGSDVESMVSDMEALRQALDETKQAATGLPQGQTYPST
jgi:outer membrane murein-binding lipoprotein Lpp